MTRGHPLSPLEQENTSKANPAPHLQVAEALICTKLLGALICTKLLGGITPQRLLCLESDHKCRLLERTAKIQIPSPWWGLNQEENTQKSISHQPLWPYDPALSSHALLLGAFIHSFEKKKKAYIYLQINNPAFSKLLLQYQQRRFQIDMSLSQKTILQQQSRC